jgi:UPF0755 protein
LSTRWRHLIVIGSIGVLALSTVFVTYLIIVRHLDSARDDVPRESYFVIQPEEPVDTIAERLHDEGLIRSSAYFRFRVRATNAGEKIIAGRYLLNSGMTTSQIIDVITSREAALAQEVSVRLIEGWRTEQFAERLLEVGLIASVEEFMDAADDPKWNDEFTFLHTRPSGVALEGYLFPDTYNFRIDSTPDEIIETLLRTFDERVAPELRAQADTLGMTLHQVITIASIVERETAVPEERAVVASVYFNRMARGMPLQADPTVQYQLGVPGNWWPHLTGADLEERGPYNTYTSPGLPPGPLCNPGLASIEAALLPVQTDFLYFVATGDGTHAFARTAEEHQANVEKYQSETPQ